MLINCENTGWWVTEFTIFLSVVTSRSMSWKRMAKDLGQTHYDSVFSCTYRERDRDLCCCLCCAECHYGSSLGEFQCLITSVFSLSE